MQFLRHDDGCVLDRHELRRRSLRRAAASYFTAEQPTWNSAAVVLAANALGGTGPTAGLFRGEGLPAGLTAEELIDAGAEIEADPPPRPLTRLQSSARCGDLIEEFAHPLLDLVADRADGVDVVAGGVVELPVLVALAREERAGVAAAHGDDDVGGPDDLVGPRLGVLAW